MPLPLIPILLAAAQVAPGLMKYFGAGETAEKVAQQVSDVAVVLTGNNNPEEAIKQIVADPQKAREFQLELAKFYQSWDEMFLKDLQDARARDAKIRASGQRNTRADTMYVLAIIVIAIVFIAIWKSPDLPEFVKGVSTLILGRFLGYLDQIYSFEFGTTRNSKQKDETISKLSGEK